MPGGSMFHPDKIKYAMYDLAYSLWYSLRALWDEFLNIFRFIGESFLLLKKPKVWSFILYLTFFYALWFNKKDILRFIVPMMIVVYVIRQRKDGGYRKEIKDRALINNDEYILKDYYNRYAKECYFSKEEALPYDLWKDKERSRINA